MKMLSRVTCAVLVCLFAAGCSNFQKTSPKELPSDRVLDRSQGNEPSTPPEYTSDSGVHPDTETSPVPSVGAKPKIALVFGPGGLRSYAYAGFLQELHRSQLPIQFIAGLEMGALPAALYAAKPQGFEAEWQMMKLKEENLFRRSLIGGSSAQDLKELNAYFQTIFGSAKIEDGKIPFTCLTTQPEKQQLLILNRGSYARAMSFCLSYPPLFRGFERHRADATSLEALVKSLRQKGATEIIYVDVLGERGRMLPSKSSEDDFLVWNLTQAHLATQTSARTGLVNEVIRIPLTEDITAFSRRRDMIRKGQETAKRLLPVLLKKYGLD